MATYSSQFGETLAGAETFERPEESPVMRTMARMFFAVFWTVIFTGCVRKWIFPGVQAFYALQEIPITIAYAYALWKGVYLRGSLMLGIVLISATVTLQALLQIITISLSPFIAIVGLHHYLYYLPMMLIFPLSLTPRYRRNFVLWNIWSALPMFVLSLAQASLPAGAFINKTSEGDAMGVPGADVPRIAGPFNFSPYYGIWISVALALCLGEWLLPPHRRASRSRFLLAAATFCWAVIGLISGSRQNILLCAAAAAGAGLVAVVTRSVRGMAMIAIGVAALPVTAGVVYVLSPSEFQIVYSRFFDSKTTSSYDMKGRLAENFYGWATEPAFSLIGKGVGLGVDAAHLGQSFANNFTYDLSESDTVRNAMELGTPVGFFWCITRYGFGLLMIVLAMRLARNSPHCLPVACALLAQLSADLTRYSTMTYTQVMIGYSFILGAAIYPDLGGVAYIPEPSPTVGFGQVSPALPEAH